MLRMTLRVGEEVSRHLLHEGENLVGSDPGCEVRIVHPTVSRHHAALVCVPQALANSGQEQNESSPPSALVVELADLGSANGTWVENERVRGKATVAPGSRVRFGSVEGHLEQVDPRDVTPFSVKNGERRPRNEEEFTAPGGESSAGTTASVGPLALFALGQLPSAVDAVLSGEASHQVVSRVGRAVLESLPCTGVDLTLCNDGRLSLLFRGGDALDDDASDVRLDERVAVAEREGLRLRARFLNREAKRLYEPLLEMTVGLLALSRRRGSVPSARPRTARRSQPMPPDPQSLEPSVRRLYARASKVARGDVHVMVLGESGTGKELLARYLHAASDRASGPFVALNCAALPRDLQESELFGVERGVATGVEARAGKFELAHGGTLFLDEIGDMALDVQAKILRVLQEGEVFRLGGSSPYPADIRVISATHRDVHQMLSDETFRQDLFHRIADWQAELPPLRERRRDIANLACYFLAESTAGGATPALSEAAMSALCAYDWPGNIRQLERELARAVLFADDGLIDLECLSNDIAKCVDEVLATSLKDQLESSERRIVADALAAHEGDAGAAAAALDVPLSTFYRKVKALGL